MNTKLIDEKLKEACYRFNINFEETNLIRSNKNFIYDCGDKILRISPSEIRSKSEVEAEINWLIFLIENNLPVVELLLSNSKTYFEIIENHNSYATVVCFKKIIGDKISKSKWTDKHFKRLGKLTGNLHRIGNQYKQKENLKYQEWNSINEFDSHKYLPVDSRELPQLHQEIVNQINQFPKNGENYGLIHYDIHHGNYLLNRQNDELILFDFEMTCKSWFINDISTVLYYANHFPKKVSDEEFEVKFMDKFREGYEQENRINEQEKEWIPTFLLFRDLMVYGFICKIWKNKKLTKPEKKYIEMIEQSIKSRRKK